MRLTRLEISIELNLMKLQFQILIYKKNMIYVLIKSLKSTQ